MIPKRIHFVFGLREGLRRQAVVPDYYLAVASARRSTRLRGDDARRVRAQGLLVGRHQADGDDGACRVPMSIFGKPIKNHAHSADVLRLQAMQKYGGIYLDSDTIVKPFDPLLSHSFVMGVEKFEAT
jgi:hypothetical protein